MYKNSSCIESKLHDAATDLLCNVFKILRSPEANCVLDRNLCEKIAAFENAYHISVACESTEKYESNADFLYPVCRHGCLLINVRMCFGHSNDTLASC